MDYYRSPYRPRQIKAHTRYIGRTPLRERGWFVGLVALSLTSGTITIIAGLISILHAERKAERLAQEPGFITICENQDTGLRVDDTHCPTDVTTSTTSGPSIWVFVFDHPDRPSTRIPAIGEKIAMIGTYTRPPGITRVQAGSAPAEGKTIQRGGFGIRGVSGTSGS